MPAIDLSIVRRGDHPPWGDIDPLVEIDHEEPWKVALLEAGMASGAPAVVLKLTMPAARALMVGSKAEHHGRPVTVIAQTSLGALVGVMAGARGAFPESFAGGPFALPDSGPGGMSSEGVWEFQRDIDGNLELSAAVMQAIGAASLCWTIASDGQRVFNTDQAQAIAHALLAFIEGSSS